MMMIVDVVLDKPLSGHETYEPQHSRWFCCVLRNIQSVDARENFVAHLFQGTAASVG